MTTGASGPSGANPGELGPVVSRGGGAEARGDPRTEHLAHGLRLVIDRDLCVGFGDCIAEAPDAFDLDDDGVAFFTCPQAAGRGRLLDACAACPVDAITVFEDGVAIIP